MAETVLLSSVVVAIAALACVAIGAVGFALKSGGRRADPVNDRDALAASRFTIPVSLIVPIDAQAGAPDDTVAALLRLNYPEFEVIVVADLADGGTLDALKSVWALSACEFFYRRSLPCREVQRIFRSARDPRLMLAEKAPAGRADALNCGVNLARYRYLCVVDTGVAFDADALLRIMSAPSRDSAVVAASSHVERRAAGSAGTISTDSARQWLASSRSLLESRIVWRRLSHGLGPDDAVVAWRRDAVLQAGGFSTRAADPNLDLMVRLQAAQGAADGRTKPSLARTAELFGNAAPRPRGTDTIVVARRQQAVFEALGAWLRHGGPDWRAAACFVTFRVVSPLCAAWVVVGTTIGASVGWFAWRDVGLAIVMLSLGQASISTASLLVRGASPDTPGVFALARLLWLAPCELVLYGPSHAVARALGVWRGIR